MHVELPSYRVYKSFRTLLDRKSTLVVSIHPKHPIGYSESFLPVDIWEESGHWTSDALLVVPWQEI